MSSYEISNIAFILLFILILFLFYFSPIISFLFLLFSSVPFTAEYFCKPHFKEFLTYSLVFPLPLYQILVNGECDLHLICLYFLLMPVGTVTFSDPEAS